MVKKFFILLIILISGCATAKLSYHDIRQSMAQVDLSDEVNYEEAVILAQNFIVKSGLGNRLYSLKPLSAKKRFVWIKGDEKVEFVVPPSDSFQFEVKETWEVLFKDRENSLFWGWYPIIPLYIEVHAETGEIVSWGLKK